MTHTQTDHS